MSQSDHPTPQDRIRHFLASMDDYNQLDAAIPIGRRVNLLGHQDDDQRRWHVLLHAFLLRKYYAPTDKLHLGRVMSAVRECAVNDRYNAEEWAAMVQNAGIVQGGAISHFGDDEHDYTDEELLLAQLYGRFLHGDFGKWQTASMAGDRGSDTAVFGYTVGRADRARSLAQWIRDGKEQGELAF